MTSRLVIGTPRIPAKPPRRFPCNHPRATGSDILPDGGFESANGYGPGGNEIPGFSDTAGLEFPFLNWSDDSPAPLPASSWFQQDVAGTATPWVVSSTNPQAGTYHVRQSMVNETVHNTLFVTRFLVCPLRSIEYVVSHAGFNCWQVGASAVVVPGDVWTLSFYAMANVVTNSNRLQVHLTYANANDSDCDTDTNVIDQALTTSYTQFTTTEVVPTADDLGVDPHLMFLAIENSWVTNSGTVTIDLDSVSLALNP